MSVVVTTEQPTRDSWQATWASLLTTENGNSVSIPVECTTRSVHVSGAVGTGGSIAVQGSNDNANWAVLSSGLGAQGDLTALAPAAPPAAVVRAIYENVRFIRPVVLSGDGATNLKVIVVAS